MSGGDLGGPTESPGPAHGWCVLEKAWVGVRRLAAANCRQTFQHRRGILRGSTVEMIGFWDPTSPTCGLLPSLSPVTDSLAPRLVDRQLPPIPIPLPQTWTWVLEPTQTIRGNKVGPSPARPFLYPSTTLTLHTGAPLFSVQADRGKRCQQRPETTGHGEKFTCTNSASLFLTLNISVSFFVFHRIPICEWSCLNTQSLFFFFYPCSLLFLSSSRSRPGASSAHNQWRRGAAAAAGLGYEPRGKWKGTSHRDNTHTLSTHKPLILQHMLLTERGFLAALLLTC